MSKMNSDSKREDTGRKPAASRTSAAAATSTLPGGIDAQIAVSEQLLTFLL